jgi:hypothetical protein
MSLIIKSKFASVSPSMCLTISGEVVMDLQFLLIPGEYHIVSLFTRLSHGPDQAAPPENDPSDFRPVRAVGVFNENPTPRPVQATSSRSQ